MQDIKELKINDKEYPAILKEINNPPKLLYYRGNLNALNYKAAIAVVGTRRCSEYGKEATRSISSGLAKAEVTIVSGLAKGIDAFAHQESLNYSSPAIAVLGTGLDDKSISPKTNLNLAHKILNSGGLLISEYKPEAKVWPSNFAERNKIIAGLSHGTLVIEAPFKSGAMITARLALDYNRDVYAVPGSIFSRLSEGCNYLIKNGAKCTTSADDILNELSFNHELKLDNPKQNTIELEGVPKIIYETLLDSPDGLHIDELARKTKINTNEISQIVVDLSLENIITETEPNCYVAIKK